MNYKPVFASGTARGGTNLIVMAASAHPRVEMVQDPYLALFKSFRNTLLRREGLDDQDPAAPLDEYYYFKDRLRVMRLLQEADLDVAFDGDEKDLQAVLRSRMELSAPLLIPHLEQLSGRNYRDLFISGLNMIAAARDAQAAEWVGFNDNWTSEFFRPLARSFPEARFIIIVRDVRAAVASHVRLVEAKHVNPLYQYGKNPAMLAMTMSFVRCWRKQIAFACDYLDCEDLSGRVHLMSYENFVREPERRVRELCDFLEIDYSPEMIDTEHYIAGDGNTWLPNSNHRDVPAKGIYSTTVDRWKESMSAELIDLVEFIAGPDLELAGYELSRTGDIDLWGAYEQHVSEVRQWEGGSFGWRTDNDDPDVDFGLELLRRRCLSDAPEDDALIERCFLFPSAYRRLREGDKLDLH